MRWFHFGLTSQTSVVIIKSARKDISIILARDEWWASGLWTINRANVGLYGQGSLNARARLGGVIKVKFKARSRSRPGHTPTSSDKGNA